MTDGERDRQELAEVLAQWPGVYRALLAAHRPDARGRCRGCTIAGTGRPGGRWPCALHAVAEHAQRLAEGQ